MKAPDPRFADQRLMAGVSPLLVSAGLAVGMLIFFAGLVYWGNRFKKMRRTTIIFYGLAGGAVLVAAAVAINHGADLPVALTLLLLVARGRRAVRPRRRHARGAGAARGHVGAVPA